MTTTTSWCACTLQKSYCVKNPKTQKHPHKHTHTFFHLTHAHTNGRLTEWPYTARLGRAPPANDNTTHHTTSATPDGGSAHHPHRRERRHVVLYQEPNTYPARVEPRDGFLDVDPHGRVHTALDAGATSSNILKILQTYGQRPVSDNGISHIHTSLTQHVFHEVC